MIGKKINQLATELAPASTDLTIIGNPTTGVSKKITLAQLGAIFSGAVSFYNDLASFPATGTLDVIFCAKDTQKLYLWSGSAYVEVFPSQALLDTYQLRSEKGVSNGYASLDSSGKVPISQLPSSIMEYKGTWNAATNTPTLANGTGDTGDVYICNVAGTVNFGAGPITFAVGDYVIYSGTIWQRSSGAVGTVTSVAATITGDAIGITGSPVTTSGTLALAFGGTNLQYINGAGNLTTFPSLTGFVPYTGATANVDLGTFDLTADILTAATGSFTSSGGGNTLEISHTSGSGIALNITKGGNGEGLYINKTSGTGNAATIVGTLEATTLVKTGGTSSQFLKADGSVDSSTYLTTSAAATTYLPMVLSSTANSIEINGQFFDVASAANSYTSGRLIIAPTYGAIGYQNAGVFDGLKILTNGNAEFSNSGITRFFNQVRFDSTLTNGTYTYTLPGASGTLALTSDLTGGTVTSVGLSSATSGVTIGSTPITTSGTITLAIATASGSQQGLLSSTDWTTFNNKQNALTNPVTGTGTTNYLPKFTGTSTIGNSLVYDTGTGGVSIGKNISAFGTATRTSLEISGSADSILALYTGSTLNGYLFHDGTDMQLLNNKAGKLDFYTSGTLRATLNASGNLGLGVNPSAWDSIYFKPLEIGNSSSRMFVVGRSDSEISAQIGLNAYYQSGWKYTNTGAASMIYFEGAKMVFRNSASGTGGNALSWTDAMTLNASGNLSVGNTNDTYKLDVSGTGRFTGNLTVSNGGYIQVNGSSNGYLNLNAANAGGNEAGIFYQIGGSNKWENYTAANDSALNWYSYGSSSIVFKLASTGAATFSSSVTAGGIVNSPTYFFRSINPATESGIETTIIATGNGENIRAGIFATNNYAADVSTSLIFKTNGSSGSATERLRITSGGNVGIGTTSPANRLTVAGSSGTIMSLSNGADADLLMNFTSGVTLLTPTTGILAFGTSSTERMRITSGGNVGIGTTSPIDKLHIVGGFTSTSISIPSNTSVGSLQIGYDGTNGVIRTWNSSPLITSTYNYQAFETSGSERMRITSGGQLLVGTTSSGNGVSNRGLITVNGSSTSMYELQVGGTEKGYVYHSGTDLYLNNSVNGGRLYCIANNSGVYLTTGATSWTANSDERLKTDLSPITNALDKVNELRSVIGRYKTDSVETKRSFLIAQDVLKVLPEAVSIDNDTMKTLGVRYTELIPLLVASIKELKAELDILKNK